MMRKVTLSPEYYLYFVHLIILFHVFTRGAVVSLFLSCWQT